jgi:hypothetical protein
MIEYIFISYVVMFFWCGKNLLCEDETSKTCFKNWLASPLSMPWYLVITFAEW